ncbi:MAG: hypothetical protein K0R75_3222 [Paenibacillaceae bacterium]|nr:hypothetical protein [Paenibacillaceae bacterium]
MNSPWLYIVLVGLVLIVYSRFLPRSAGSSKQGQSTKEFQESLDNFAAVMDNENRELVQLISSMRREHEQQTGGLTMRIQRLEQQLSEQEIRFAKLSRITDDLVDREARNSFHRTSPPPVEPVPQAVPPAAIPIEMNGAQPQQPAPPGTGQPSLMRIKERYSELFDLHNQGKSVDFIAKKLNMNKGEINLILQLARQEERLNA